MKAVIFHFTEEDKPYLGSLKPIFSGRAQVYLDNTYPTAAMEFVIKSKQKGGASIVSTSPALLALLLPEVSKPKISDHAGNIIKYKDVEFLFVDPLKNLFTVSYGKFILERFLSKLLAPTTWLVEPSFKWELFAPNKLEELFTYFDSCVLIGVDIETKIADPNRVITCISFSGMQLIGGHMVIRTVCIPMTDIYHVNVMRLFCSGPAAKVLQNGKYDIAYLLRYGSPLTNYAMDTINLFHCWLCELPKDLGFINSFMLRNYIFHKNDGKSGDLHEYYQYNAQDAFTTLLSAVAILVEAPDYLDRNFLQEFPVVFPCILAEATGMKWDSTKAAELKTRVDLDMEQELVRLQTRVAAPYNPNSPPQTVKLFELLGSKDVRDSTPPSKDKVSNRHPLNKLIIDSIISYRENSKLRGSYYKEGVSWNGRCFYALNPHATDTGRLASRESAFWCGLQVQNIPRNEDGDGDDSVKEAFLADNDFYFGEVDRSQAESRDTAYLSGDTALIAAVDDVTKDFHGINASAFFGVPYEEIVKSTPIVGLDGEIEGWVHKTLDKVLRNDIGKRINHGANYNMGPQVMLDTMGIRKVLLAKEKLNLPRSWEPLKVTGYLLAIFSKTYHIMKGPYYDKIIHDVATTGLLTGPTGWTRRCFGNPKKNKHHLNSYVAHPSQSLNAMELNVSWRRVFMEVYLPNPQDFKLCAQIHDSILFQYRKGREDLVWKVADAMINPIAIKDIFGKTRILTIPVDVKGNGSRWSEVETMKRPKVSKLTAAA